MVKPDAINTINCDVKKKLYELASKCIKEDGCSFDDLPGNGEQNATSQDMTMWWQVPISRKFK